MANNTKSGDDETLNEKSVIKILWGKFGDAKHTDPFNDDAAWIRNSRTSKLLVAKADMMVATTDAPEQMTPAQLARKSVVACVSDLAAKGVRPLYCILSLGLPKKLSNPSFVSGMADGFALAEEEYGLKIVGGDTNATLTDPVIDCSIYGFANNIVKRRGARKGDLIGVSGKFGHQAAGLLLLLGKAKTPDEAFKEKSTSFVLEPHARLDFGLKASKYLTSCIDSSDGLAISLYHLAESSDVDFELVQLPMENGVEQFALENGLDASNLTLFGGEEYELIFTFNPRYEMALSRLGASTIGKVAKKSSGCKPAVRLGPTVVPRRGWLHFQSE